MRETLLLFGKKLAAPVFFFADNDQWGKTNTGLEKANSAMKAGDKLIYPTFNEKYSVLKPTDFNDLIMLGEYEEFFKQMGRAWQP